MMEIETPGEPGIADRCESPEWLTGLFGIPLLGQVFVGTVVYAVLAWSLTRFCDDYALYARWAGALPSAFDVAQAWIAAYGLFVCARRRDLAPRVLGLVAIGCALMLAVQIFDLGCRFLMEIYPTTDNHLVYALALIRYSVTDVLKSGGMACLVAAVRRALGRSRPGGLSETDGEINRPRRPRFQFGIGSLLLAMMVVAVYGSLVHLHATKNGVSNLLGYLVSIGPALLVGAMGWGLSFSLQNLRRARAGAPRQMLQCTAIICLPPLLSLPLSVGLVQFFALEPLVALYSWWLFRFVFRCVWLLAVILFGLWLGTIYRCATEFGGPAGLADG
jgi:hypothetical protein